MDDQDQQQTSAPVISQQIQQAQAAQAQQAARQAAIDAQAQQEAHRSGNRHSQRGQSSPTQVAIAPQQGLDGRGYIDGDGNPVQAQPQSVQQTAPQAIQQAPPQQVQPQGGGANNDPYATIDQQYGKQQQGQQQSAGQNGAPVAPPTDSTNDPYASIDQQYGKQQGQGQKPSTNGDLYNTAFMDGVEAFNRQFGRIAEGTFSLIPGVAQAAQGVHDNMEASYQQAQQRSPIATAIGSTVGGMAAGAAYGGPLMGSPATVLGAMGRGAMTAAALGYADYGNQPGPPPTQQTRLARAGIAAPVGAVAGGTMHLIGEAINPTEPVINDTMARLRGQYTDPEIAAKISQANTDAANTGVKLGIGETFPETQGVEVAALKPSAAVKNTQIAPAYYGQVSGIKNNLTDMVSNMAPDNAKEDMQNLFGTMGQQFLDKDGAITTDPSQAVVPDIIKNNPILAQKYGEVTNAQSPQLQSLPQNSIAQLHEIKDSIDNDLIKSTPNKMGITEKPLGKDPRFALQAAKNQLSNSDGTGILNTSPEYNQAMDLGAKQAIQNTYQTIMNQIKTKAGTSSEATPIDLRTALFNTPEKQQQFLKDVITTGGNPDQAQSVINVVDGLSKSPLKRIINASYEGDSAFKRIYDNPTSVAKMPLAYALHGRYYNAAVKLAIDPNWTDKVGAALQLPTKEAQQVGVAHLMMDPGLAHKVTTSAGSNIPALSGVVPALGTHVGNSMLASPQLDGGPKSNPLDEAE